MILKTDRQQLEAVTVYYFPYINLLKATRMNNVAHLHQFSDEVLFAAAGNCLLTEIRDIIRKKLLAGSIQIKLKISDAQALALYRSMLSLKIPDNQVYLLNIRNNWIAQLDAHMIAAGIFSAGYQVKDLAPPSHDHIYVDYEDY